MSEEKKKIDRLERIEYVEAFNINVVNMLRRILIEGEEDIKDIKLFHLNMSYYRGEDDPDLFIDEIVIGEGQLNEGLKKLKTMAIEDPYLGYYWTTYKKDNHNYRINMFFRSFDVQTGNFHIYPGPIQRFKEKDSSNPYIKNGKYAINVDGVAYAAHNGEGSRPYCEEEWEPYYPYNRETITKKIPMIWDKDNMADVAKAFWQKDITESLCTLKSEESNTETTKRFYSIKGKYEEWGKLLYPEGCIGTQYPSAFHLFKFKNVRENAREGKKEGNKLIQNYYIIELNGEMFCIFDGKPHEWSYDKKTNQKEFEECLDEYVKGSKKRLDNFLAGPNYITDDGWEFMYKIINKKNNKFISIFSSKS